MKREVGYGVSVLGIGVMAIGLNIIPIDWEILNLIGSNYVVGAGLVLVGVGIMIALMNKNKVKSEKSEVPIYEGLGKSRRIVGYRRG